MASRWKGRNEVLSAFVTFYYIPHFRDKVSYWPEIKTSDEIGLSAINTQVLGVPL